MMAAAKRLSLHAFSRLDGCQSGTTGRHEHCETREPIGSAARVVVLNEALQELRRLRPNRAGSFFATFPSEEHAARRTQAEIGNLQPNNLADPCAGVEHQTQERQISATVGRIRVHGLEHGLDFVKVQMLDFTAAGAFERDAQNALSLLQMFRMLCAQIAKEAVDGA